MADIGRQKKFNKMDEQELIEIIIKSKKWFDSKIEQLQRLVDAPADMKINFEGKEGTTIELPDKDRKAFLVGISVAIEIIGKFPINIEANDNTEDD